MVGRLWRSADAAARAGAGRPVVLGRLARLRRGGGAAAFVGLRRRGGGAGAEGDRGGRGQDGTDQTAGAELEHGRPRSRTLGPAWTGTVPSPSAGRPVTLIEHPSRESEPGTGAGADRVADRDLPAPEDVGAQA